MSSARSAEDEVTARGKMEHRQNGELIPGGATAARSEIHIWGIDHHRADTEIRERVYLSAEGIRRFAAAFAAEDCGLGSVVLCTCNRTEFYLEVRAGCRGRSAFRRTLEAVGLDAELFFGHLGYHLTEPAAVLHLYRVNSGLESMVLGEAQISAQIKTALRQSAELQQLGPRLARVFQSALHAAKRVRTETALGAGTVSIAYTAVEEASRRCGSLAERHALLIGAGKTGALAARHLLRRGIGRLTLLNRSLERAQEVASRLEPALNQQVHVRALAELDTVLPESDIVLTATGSPEPIFDCACVAPAVARRNGTPLYLFDVAVPRDVAPEVRALGKVEVIGLDELSCIVDQTLEARRSEIPRAETILEEELREYAAWAQTLPVQPMVKELRCYLDELIAREMAWVRKKQPPETARVVEESLQVLVKKIMQRPVKQLKTAASDRERHQDLASLQRLFQLGDATAAESSEG